MSTQPKATIDEATTVRSGERVTLNLTEKGSTALNDCMAIGLDSKTDTINRALAVYALLLKTQRNTGGAIYLREDKDAELERVRLL